MAFFKKKEYEIHTSMSEELILEELREMKRKFVPVTPLTAERFDLMVLAPSHQSGRRRSGGFVQLVGAVSSRDDERCIHIKTCSGLGFILPMSLALFFLCAITCSILAGNWTVQLLAPLGFLFVFFVVMLSKREKAGREGEEILREHFEGADRAVKFCYTAHYTKDQCLEFMKHDNAEDIYQYEWRQEKTFGALIIKNYKIPDFIHDFNGRQEWGFIVRFREQPDTAETLIEAELVQTEKLPFIHDKAKVDVFWEKKLGAKCDKE